MSTAQLIPQWVKALQDAEAIEARINPEYRRHSDDEIHRAATIAVYQGRDAHDWVSEMLTEGAHPSSISLADEAAKLFAHYWSGRDTA